MDKCSVVRAKCVCNIDNGLQNAWNEVCKRRDACDKALQGQYWLKIFRETLANYLPNVNY